MKFNTLIKHRMSATYNPWVEYFEETDGLTYRDYREEDEQPLACTLFVSTVGNIQLLSHEKLQMFGVIRDMYDASGELIDDEQWYTVQRVQPAFDGSGAVTSYRHTLAAVDGQFFAEPITPKREYPGVDQS